MMTPPAVSQILEQFVRVVTMVVLAYYLLPYGLEYAAAGAAFGAVPGSITGLIVLSFFYLKNKLRWQQEISRQITEEPESIRKIAKRLVLLALPVSCANIMVPVTSSIDMLLVPNRLVESGFSVEEATTPVRLPYRDGYAFGHDGYYSDAFPYSKPGACCFRSIYSGR